MLLAVILLSCVSIILFCTTMAFYFYTEELEKRLEEEIKHSEILAKIMRGSLDR